MADAAGTVRQDPDSKRTAIKMDLPDPRMAWFVLDVASGGHYTNGERDGVAEWPQLVAQ